MNTRDKAIKAAALAIWDEEGPECIDDDGAAALAGAALDAAVPRLLYDLAERVANQAWDEYTAAAIVRAAAEGWGQ